MCFSKEQAAVLRKEGHFPGEGKDGKVANILEWSITEIQQVTGAMSLISVSISSAPRGIDASLRSVDIEAFMSLLEGRLRAVDQALHMAIKGVLGR